MSGKETIEEKIKQCKKIVIQNMETNSVKNKTLFVFLQKLLTQGKDLINSEVHSKQGFAKIELKDHKTAESFIENNNFKEGPIYRKLNIYYDVQLDQKDCKKFYLEGITDDNQRQIYDISKKYGAAKLQTYYAQYNKAPISSTGTLSIARTDDLTQAELAELTKKLSDIGVILSAYIYDKSFKCQIKVTNFHEDESEKEQLIIKKEAEATLRKFLKTYIQQQPKAISVYSKKVSVKEKITTKIWGLVEYGSNQETIEKCKYLRQKTLDQAERVQLVFNSGQSNSYKTLFTSGLVNNENLQLKHFQKKLLDKFQLINKNVVQVNVYPIKVDNQIVKYAAKLYLTNEEQGKNFILSYFAKKEHIHQLYKNQHKIQFDINIDPKLLRKIRKHVKIANTKAAELKNNQQQRQKTLNQNNRTRVAHFNPPISNYGVGFALNMGPNAPNMSMPPFNISQGAGKNMPASKNMPNRNPNFNPNINTNMFNGPNMPGYQVNTHSTQNEPTLASSIESLLRYKEALINKNSAAPKIMFNVLKQLVEKNGLAKDPGIFTEELIKKCSIPQLFEFIENPQKLKDLRQMI